jgi:hypothetical protein
MIRPKYRSYLLPTRTCKGTFWTSTRTLHFTVCLFGCTTSVRNCSNHVTHVSNNSCNINNRFVLVQQIRCCLLCDSLFVDQVDRSVGRQGMKICHRFIARFRRIKSIFGCSPNCARAGSYCKQGEL